ncbi:hypothetical protein [Luteolibacter marinus]|uniref:hypothetical protein n=1 Tax=Luteolibacter marinus TaxID=2776705 RepID=UPI001869605C|nr:hypothetical protein [Luteolibacter marinus]
MASQPSQMMLFEAVQTANADGSFTVRPQRVAVVKEIDVKRASRILGYHADTVRRLCELGEAGGGLKAYKNPSARGNAKWRIDWESAMSYKTRRQDAARRGCA